MATTPTSPVNLSSVVNTLSMSKARLKRRHTTRKDSITNGGTTTSQLITSSEANTIEKENETLPLGETQPQQRQHSTPSMEETRQEDSLSVARDTPVTSNEDNNPNGTAIKNTHVSLFTIIISP